MDYAGLITQLGFPIGATVIVSVTFYKFLNKRIEKQDMRIDKLEETNKMQSEIFSKAVDSFNTSVRELSVANNKLDNIERDIEYIKEKVK